MSAGNTLISGAEYAAPNNWIQKEEGIEDSPEAMAEDMLTGGDNLADPELVKTLCENALSGAEWLRDDVKVEWTDELMHFGGHSITRSLVPKGATGEELITKLVAKAKDAGITLYYNVSGKEILMEDGKAIGVYGESKNGDTYTLQANRGVILATGGYGANIAKVQETNDYWDDSFIADNIGTTNRSSLQGDGITMAEEVGADTDGMGWTQMMPLGWVDNGNLAGGAGENVIYINAATGKRYVDESAERDVLSKGAFENGMTKELADELGLKYVPGIYVEVSNTAITAGVGGFSNGANDIEGRMYFKTVAEVAEMLHLDEQTLRDTITEYDNYVMGTSTDLPVEKLAYTATVGDVEKDENGNYLPDTYKLENLRIRFLAPSTHHTMGGLVTDVNHHVLDKDGKTITGLYAAGEVTSGYHAGNRLGGNAITEIIVSGRDAAKAVTEDNK